MRGSASPRSSPRESRPLSAGSPGCEPPPLPPHTDPAPPPSNDPRTGQTSGAAAPVPMADPRHLAAVPADPSCAARSGRVAPSRRQTRCAVALGRGASHHLLEWRHCRGPSAHCPGPHSQNQCRCDACWGTRCAAQAPHPQQLRPTTDAELQGWRRPGQGWTGWNGGRGMTPACWRPLKTNKHPLAAEIRRLGAERAPLGLQKKRALRAVRSRAPQPAACPHARRGLLNNSIASSSAF
mmetsp:Transcript_6271/g.17994  ORF Transcript_6271/g.17994 Transcript_6271/m.17994 type:complete len:238 (-) Transcript_6271:184-897(-)